MLRNFEFNGERTRGITILKSRGTPHSNQIREFVMSEKGIELIRPYVGPSGVFMGSAKIAQEAKDNATMKIIERDIENKQNTLEEKQKELEAKIIALKAQYKAEENDLVRSIEQTEQTLKNIKEDSKLMLRARK
jgi:circadian clock protein KaiC